MKIRILIGAFALLALFQNCAEPLNPEDYSDQSSTSAPDPTTPPPATPPPTTPPTTPPPPTAPPTVATTVTITAQSAATINLTEGQNLFLYVTSVTSPATVAVVYEWRKGTTIIASGASAAATYQKAAAVVADTGAYQVFIKDPVTTAVLAQSAVFNVTVSPPSVNYNPATFIAGGMTYYLTHFVSDTVGSEVETVTAFCKAKHGIGATVVRYSKLPTTPIAVNRALYLRPGSSCGFTNLTNGLCGYNIFPFQVVPFNIDCRP
jgi:hypothetical protein